MSVISRLVLGLSWKYGELDMYIMKHIPNRNDRSEGII